MKFSRITPLQERDTCMALTSLFLVLFCFLSEKEYVFISIAILVVGMVFPKFYKPIAYFWYGLANILGNFVSKILLTLVWICILFPVAFSRRLLGKDPMQLKQWKTNQHSCFHIRNYTYKPSDLEHPY